MHCKELEVVWQYTRRCGFAAGCGTAAFIRWRQGFLWAGILILQFKLFVRWIRAKGNVRPMNLK
jgi:hypothetical protein